MTVMMMMMMMTITAAAAAAAKKKNDNSFYNYKTSFKFASYFGGCWTFWSLQSIEDLCMLLDCFLLCSLFYNAVSNSDLRAADYSINELDRI